MSADSGPGNREVAHRIFAAEFDDATLSYSESDEERAPNYVVTPTGARVNRLFAVGVLTEVESVNEETLRGRVVDPTGAFVTYAGQYQPDEHAFLGRTTPPAFVAMTGKARTFEPEDGDAVYTSVRPESLNAVDAATRDRWTVSAAESTLRRLAVFAAALESGLEGARLRAALAAAGVDESLAAGVPKAIEHYGTTTAYLEGVRTLAVQSLQQVTGDREDVDPLRADPDSPGAAELGSLPAVDLDLSVPEGFEAEPDEAAEAGEPEPADAAETAASVDADAEDEQPATAEPTAATGEPTAATDEPTEDGAEASSTESTSTTAAAGADESPEVEGAESEPEETGSEPAEAAAAATSESGAGGGAAEPEIEAEPEAEAELAEAEPADEGAETDDLGDFAPSGSSTESAAEAEDDGDELGDFDATEDALTDEERAEVEAEYGTDFSTGGEVDGPGEAGIDVPSSAEELDELESEDGAPDSEATEPAAAETAKPDLEADEESEVEEAADEAATADEADDDATDEAGADAADVDLEGAAVDAMRDLDDGDGADHDEVVASVVDDTGADPGAVEEAIQSALMSGQCYEPADGKLKAI